MAKKVFIVNKSTVGKMFKVSQRTINRIVNSSVYCREGYYV